MKCKIVALAMLASVVGGAYAQTNVAPAQSDPAAAPFGRLPSFTTLQPSASTASLPNGASSITEVYGDWTIECRIGSGQKLCSISQAQGDRQSGARTFSIELRTPAAGKTDGVVVMPFGIDLDAGALLKLDDKDLAKGLRFSTCIADGCLLPVSFPALAIDALKGAKTLVVGALNLGNGSVVAFNVSLNGFAAALARLSQLGV